MNVDRRLETIADRTAALWVAAVLLYGVGDTATTVWGLSAGGVAEAGPVAAPLVAAHGAPVLVGLKVAVFGVFLGAFRALRTPGRSAVPLALVVVGAAVTLWNLFVIANAV